MDERSKLYALLRERFPQTAKAKLEAAAHSWLSGERNISEILRQVGWNRSYHGKVSKAFKEIAPIMASEAQVKADMVQKYIESEATGQPMPQAPPAQITSTPKVELIGGEETVKLLSGPAYLEKVDGLLLEALEEGTSERSIKILHDIRKDLADFAAEMPVTHMDIERTVGLEGLAGMDDVLVDTLSLFFEDIDHYPKCKQFLSDTFGVGPGYWNRKNQQATP